MRETTPEEFAAGNRTVVVAPAGCGKTELIVRSVAAVSSARDLILTHTHAGLRALGDRLHRARIAKRRAPVETIAGWCLRIAASYPRLSGLTTTEPGAEQWNEVYAAAVRALQVPAIRTMLQNSYSGVYIDEYQDCTKLQHAVIRHIAELLPCRVVGDPLQSIFGFAGDELVSWSDDVFPFFEALPALTTPHRWRDVPELGAWLMDARDRMLAGQTLDLVGGPVQRIDPDPATLTNAFRLLRATGADSTVVAITKFPAQCHSFAKRNRGYHSLEPVECPDLIDWSRSIDDATGPGKADLVLRIAQKCFTGMSELKAIRTALVAGKALKPGTGKWSRVRQTAAALAANGTPAELVDALEALGETSRREGRLYRAEAWSDLVRAARALSEGQHVDLREASWARRQHLRSNGKKPPRCCVGRPVLIKGLEFTHAAILGGADFKAEDLYVAITRGSQTLRIVTAESHLVSKGREDPARGGLPAGRS
ncbi:MAG: UvrD-helicase domain-containing protein [Thermoanaerobaculia bacterium]